MRKCAKCGLETISGNFNYDGFFYCDKCQDTTNFLHVDTIILGKKGIEISSPLEGLKEEEQRERFITLIYVIFNQKINPAAFRLMENYLKKGFTYLDLIRAMEYFYIVKKNSTEKSNNNIGIIPYIFKDSQKYFNSINAARVKRYEAMSNAQKAVVDEKVVVVEEENKTKQIDMESL